MFRFLLIALLFGSTSVYALPRGFVYLDDVDPTIAQDMRYASNDNFVGRVIDGYQSPRCILTRQAADHLHDVQVQLLKQSFSLVVYDCYRPVRAVTHFYRWSQSLNDERMKTYYYPRVNKADVFKLGYVAKQSGHSRGSTIDLSIIMLPTKKYFSHVGVTSKRSCLRPSSPMQKGAAVDMGSQFDCLDTISHIDTMAIGKRARGNRLWLKSLMENAGFIPYDKEWWHFTLKNEPFSQDYFNFLVV